METPAFITDQTAIVETMKAVDEIRKVSGVNFLYTLKPNAHPDVMIPMIGHVDGFAASSVNEARISRAIIGDRGSVHITTPGFRQQDICELGDLCDYAAMNSLGQFERFGNVLSEMLSLGIRVNPHLSFVKDDRYNPCRAKSKLGVDIGDLSRKVEDRWRPLDALQGIHFHTNCESKTFKPLLKTAERISEKLGHLLDGLEWINMGGGYLFEDEKRRDSLYAAISLFQDKHKLKVYMEPGGGCVRNSGYIVTSVIDLFESDGQKIAMLDTTVNHMPEVYEYQFEPDVSGYSEKGKHEYLLAGATCLAGDLLGVYTFDEPLKIGSRLAVLNSGAYTQVKSHMFNGVSLPSVYSVTLAGDLLLRKKFEFEDYISQFGEEYDAAIRA